MSPTITRWLLAAGIVAGVVFFAGDMAFLGDWGSGASFVPERVFNVVAGVAVWRLYLGALLGPVGIGLELLAMLGIWSCCRRAAPRSALVMLAGLYTFELFARSPQGKFGALGFALRYCGSDGDAVRHLLQLNDLMTAMAGACLLAGFGLWIVLTLAAKSSVPRWTVLFCPLLTVWLTYGLVYVPAPLGFPLTGGWTSLCFAAFFSVLTLTCRARELSDEPSQPA